MRQPGVAHVISTPKGIGGAERVLEWLVDGASARGWDVAVLNPFDEDPDGSALRELLGDRYRAVKRPAFAGVPGARRWLRDELEALGPDIVHAHLFHALFLVATLPRRVAPFTLLSQQHGDYLGWRGRPGYRALDRWAERRFDRVVPCSHAVERVIVDEFGVDPARVTVIHNGWAGSPRPPARDDAHPTFLCVANLRAEKNHDVLLEAFADVHRNHPQARLNLVGAGPRRAELDTVVSRLGIEDAVTFTGAVDDVWPHFAAADVFVLPSSFEPLGIVVMEAMAASLPVIATRVGGIPELVDEGTTGLLVNDGDALGLSSAMERLLAAPEERADMGERGRAVAEELHADRMVDRYFDVYDAVIRGQRQVR